MLLVEQITWKGFLAKEFRKQNPLISKSKFSFLFRVCSCLTRLCLLLSSRFDRVNLWSGQALNLFPNGLKESSDPLKVWNILQNRELQAAFETAPRNYFEKMQRWTVEGKIWRFPIDNEQGLEEEAKVYFADHVFLEPHIEPWCPKTGPVRHFMELVCVGLSKNPYITVREKQEHIEWFRNYFENKKELLQEIIIQDDGPRPGTSESKTNK